MNQPSQRGVARGEQQQQQQRRQQQQQRPHLCEGRRRRPTLASPPAIAAGRSADGQPVRSVGLDVNGRTDERTNGQSFIESHRVINGQNGWHKQSVILHIDKRTNGQSSHQVFGCIMSFIVSLSFITSVHRVCYYVVLALCHVSTFVTCFWLVLLLLGRQSFGRVIASFLTT